MRTCAASLVSLFLVLLHPNAFSQSFVWGKQITSAFGKNVTDITVDNNGDVYTIGNFNTEADFDPGPATRTLKAAGTGTSAIDVFICKLDASGNFVWAKQIGSTGIDYAGSIAHDKDGNIYVIGSFANTADFDPGPGVYDMASTNGSMFILKLDASGDFLFAKQLSANSSKILIDSTGNILIACDVQGLPVDFDPGPSVFNITPKENSDVVVCKLTATGDFIWAKQIGGSSYDGSSVLEIDKDNNVFIGGYFYGTCDFDPGPATYNLTSAGESDIFVTKLDASGNFVWARSMGDYYRESIFDLKFDFSGNIVLTGRTEGGGDFDPGADVAYLNGKGGSDCILIKLSGQGNLVWAKLIGSSFDEDGNSLSIDQAGNITLAGAFTGALDLDPGVGIAMTSLSGIFDIFIARYNASGEFITSRQIGGKYWDACKGLFTDPSGNLYMTGTFQGEVDFDPGPRVYSMTGPVSASSAPADIFICKFGKNNQITGTTYFDANHDGSRQPSEFILPNIPVNASRDGLIYQVRSDTNGLFLIEADTGTYSVTVPAIAYYPVVVPSTHTASFGSLFGSYDTANHFALQPAGNIKDLRVVLTNVMATRRGFHTIFRLTFQNIGTVPLSGNVDVWLDSALSFNESRPEQSSYAFPHLSYSFTNLMPSALVNADISLYVSTSVPLGDTLKTIAVISPLAGDAATQDNSDTLYTVVTGSFDPNDKSVSPWGPILPDFISNGNYLDYTIRFQNTGNDTAFTVVIKDTLSSLLDPTSWQMLSASHNYTIVQKENIIEWHFDNIFLPDSSHSEPKSHGFVRFRARPKSTVTAGAQIRNKAAIYFDFNEPVITNETNTLVDLATAVYDPVDTPVPVRLFPNPAGDFIKLACKGLFTYAMYTVSGQQVLPLSKARDEAIINTMWLSKGVYFLELTHSNRKVSYKILVQ